MGVEKVELDDLLARAEQLAFTFSASESTSNLDEDDVVVATGVVTGEVDMEGGGRGTIAPIWGEKGAMK